MQKTRSSRVGPLALTSAIFLVAAPGCASILGDFDVGDQGDTDGGDASMQHPVEAGPEAAPPNKDAGPEAGNDGAVGDAFIVTEGGADACAPETADDAAGIFVAPNGAAVSCGTRASPCGTITAGISAAAAQSKTVLYVAAGTYTEKITLVQSGLSIEGGWSISGTSWARGCDPGATIVQAPATAQGTVYIQTGGTPKLDTLTIRSKASAGPGESLYGIYAPDPATHVTLTNVDIDVAAGGDGAPGTPGTSGTGPTTTCSSSGSGAAGAAGAPGSPAGPGTFSTGGYIAANGANGSDGAAGQNGTLTQPDSHICINPGKQCTVINTGIPVCSYVSSTQQSGGAGAPGCGGAAGTGGGGGGGGGSSFGIYSSGAAFTIVGGSVKAGNGGKGGNGGAGGQGTPGSAGATGATYFQCGECGFDANNQCTQTNHDLKGGVGGPGGAGSSGGTGGAGSGGSSFAIYAPATTPITVSAATTITAGTAGQGGTSNGTGAAGKSGARGP